MMSRQHLYGLLALTASILLQVIGSIMLFSLHASVWTLFVMTSIVTTLIFFVVQRGRIGRVLTIIKQSKGTVLLINLCMMTMMVVLYMCLAAGLSPAFYSIVFAVSLGMLVSIEKQSIWLVPFAILLVTIFCLGDHRDLMSLALLGPLACYWVLKLTSDISQRYTVTTSEIMILRYAFIIIPAVFSIPWLPPLTTEPMTSLFWCSLAMVVVGFNILPIFFSQMSTLKLGHQVTAIGVAFLPFLTFIAEYEILGIAHVWLTPLSVVLTGVLILSLKWPKTWPALSGLKLVTLTHR